MTDPDQVARLDGLQVSWMDAAYARDRDPSTSHEAAAGISLETLRMTQAHVLGLFKRYGAMTDKGLLARAREHLMLQSDSGLRTRRAELVKMGKMRWSGMYDTINGRKHRMWEVV